MYDPFIDDATASSQPLPESYWASTVTETTQFSQLTEQRHCDIAIIGSGFTGMSCAHYLQQQQGVNAVVLEANQPGWGCSGRNAGFVLPGSGRLDFGSLCKQYGEQQAQTTINEYYQALETLEDLVQYADAKCDLSTGGYLKIGHSQQAFENLCRGTERLPEEFAAQYEIISAEQVKSDYIPDYPSFGGVYRKAGQSLNPLKLSLALANKLASDSVPIYGNSPVLNIVKTAQGYQVNTPQGTLTCEKVVLASNAYSLKNLLPGLSEKQFPVLSSVLVTSGLPQAVAEQWQANLMAMDTRSLKYYFRLLPDNRLLFGGRGAITGAEANTKQSQLKLKAAFDRYFPALKQLSTDWFWSGWVSVSADDIPHVLQSEQYPGIYYATGYCGSGLAYSCQAGKRLADYILTPEKVPQSPVYQKPLPAFPFSAFRRTGLQLFYAWHRLVEQITMK